MAITGKKSISELFGVAICQVGLALAFIVFTLTSSALLPIQAIEAGMPRYRLATAFEWGSSRNSFPGGRLFSLGLSSKNVQLRLHISGAIFSRAGSNPLFRKIPYRLDHDFLFCRFVESFI